MAENTNDKILELEAKIKSLQLENAFLSSNAEDITLISSISEKIGSLTKIEVIFNEVVEKISILKNIPYCAIGTLNGNNINIDSEYSSFSEKKLFARLSLSPLFAADLLKETIIIKNYDSSENTIATKIKTNEFSPNSFLITIFSNNMIKDKVLICIDTNMKDYLFSTKKTLLQALSILNSRIDNLQLMHEITNQNQHLERRVAERTNKLKEEYESRIKFENELKMSNERFRTIFDSINDGIFVHEIETGRILELNTRAHEMLGYNNKEMLNLKVGDFSEGIPPYTQYEALKWIKAAVAGEPQLFEWRAKRKDGSIIWVEVNMKLAIIGGQKRVLVSSRDISEKKTLKQVIEDSESITKILFDHSSIQIWEENFAEVKRYIDNLKREGVKYFEAYFNENPEKLQEIAGLVKINSVNKKTLEFYNVSSMDELKLNLPSWFVESSWSVFKDEIVALANNKDRFEGEITVQTGNGELKHLFLSLSVPPSNIKDLKRVIISFVDITDRKNAEENLEAKVLERTAQLEEANRDLEELNEVFMNRELRVMELREEVERLKNKLNNI